MKDREKWMDLCEQVSKERDPEKLTALIRELDRLLGEKQQQREHPPDTLNPKAEK